MITILVTILVVLLVTGAVVWIINQIPLPIWVPRVVSGIVILIALLWLLNRFYPGMIS